MSKKEKAKQSKQKWVLTVVCLSFGLSVVMSFVTSMFVESAGLLVALLAVIVRGLPVHSGGAGMLFGKKGRSL